MQPVITVICDFDGTLGPDTTSLLLKSKGIDPEPFWGKITNMVKRKEWDPTQAYMHKIIELTQTGEITPITRKELNELGQKVKLFPGVSEVFPELKEFVQKHASLKDRGIQIEFYIISGGLKEIIRGTPIANHMAGIFGCHFHHKRGSGYASSVKSTISFTEKTKFVYAIHKGISPTEIRKEPYLVNSVVKEGDRRIPISNMVYIGDGPSDIPCMSMITKREGKSIGVTQKGTAFKKGYELAIGGRTTVGPYSADFRAGSDMRNTLEEIIVSIGTDIGLELRKGIRDPVTH